MPAVRCLISLAYMAETRALLGPHTAQLLAIFGKLLGGSIKGIDRQLEDEIRSFVKWLRSLAPQQLFEVVAALHDGERAPLLEVLQGSL